MDNMLKILIGLPGCGKSTYCENFVDQTNIVVLSSDDIREKIYGCCFNEDIRKGVFLELIELTVAGLHDDKDVILDTTYLNDEEHRDLFIREVKKRIGQVHVEAVFFDISLSECILRDKKRKKTRQIGGTIIRELAEKLSLSNKAGLLEKIEVVAK